MRSPACLAGGYRTARWFPHQRLASPPTPWRRHEEEGADEAMFAYCGRRPRGRPENAGAALALLQPRRHAMNH